MKYLFFKDANRDYKAEIERVKLGSLWMAVGMYEDKDAKKLLKDHKGFVSEIDQVQYEDLLQKKTQSVTGRVFKTQPQDPSRDPNAVYAEEKSKPTSPKVKDLISVGDAVVENPLEGSD
jgi:hypothetical protein